MLRRSSSTLASFQRRSSQSIQANWLKSDEQIAGRYSVGKLMLLRRYEQNTSITRVLCVLLLSFAPAIVIIFGLELIPLDDPSKGLRGNVASIVRSGVTHSILTFMFLLPCKQALQLVDCEQYAIKHLIMIALFTTVILEALWVAVALGIGRYPVPMRELAGMVPWTILVSIGHVLFAKQPIASKLPLLKLYMPVLGAEVTLFYLFLMLAIGFARVPGAIQIAMVLAFPIIKVVVKKWLWMYAKHVPDLTTIVTICMVEIAGALYQTLCLQYANSMELSALIIVMDFMQVALEVRMYLGDESLMDSTKTMRPALERLEQAAIAAASGATAAATKIEAVPSKGPPASTVSAVAAVHHGSDVLASRLMLVSPTVSAPPRAPSSHVTLPQTVSATVVPVSFESISPTASPPSSEVSLIDGVPVQGTKAEIKVMENALHRLFSCEVLVFVEYMEIFMPTMYSLYIGGAHKFANVKYNLIVAPMSAIQIHATVVNALVYATLEAVSFAFMCWFMKSKYGISPLHQLAFVLENYWMTLQGKLIGCLISILGFITLHQGVDFSFQFDFDTSLSHSG